MVAKRVIYGTVAGILLILGASLSVQGEESTVEITDVGVSHEYSRLDLVPLIDSASNFIIDSQAMLSPVIAKLSRIRQGSFETLSIIHIGDSHIQAGYFTGAIRQNFQRDFGNSGRGLIVPLKLAGTNEPPDYRITTPNRWEGTTCLGSREQNGTIGVAGMGITSADSNVEFTITANEHFSIVRAFHHPQAPWLREPDELSIGSYCPDDELPCVTSIFLDDTTRNLTLKAPIRDSLYNYQTYYGFSLETGTPGILYHSAGINGAAFAHYNNNPCIMNGQQALNPDMIIVSLGTNDSYGNSYKETEVIKHIERFLEMYDHYFPGTPLLFTTPMESCQRKTVKRRATYPANNNVARTGEIIKNIALTSGKPYWDLYSAAGGEGASSKWHSHGLMSSDRLHPTKEGYAFQGEMLYDAFTKYYNTQVLTHDGEF